jgi:hypothetical protein
MLKIDAIKFYCIWTLLNLGVDRSDVLSKNPEKEQLQ